ncbi:MAG: transposase [Candidatus Moeniiplasma glomeromycotorum]|nr:transposase [Candidatus Moeniiplasma glomeromycotorum]MCE8167575.1 transposase [Candidatus Moeniiplasma glomeromycotorum]MCE8169073.1 transposase [Candidatus Moeniiplasma glomeromycotorum]
MKKLIWWWIVFGSHHASWTCRKLGLSTIKELLENKNIEPLYLPPYTPEMNPVELCFNLIKGEVRKEQPETYEELELAIERVLELLHKKDLTGYFRHCCFYEPPEKGVNWIKV